jgi:hypothetical protein
MGAGVEEGQGGKFLDERLVDRGLEVVVEVAQVLGDREVREAEPGSVAALAGGGDLLAEECFQERHVRQLLGAGGLEVGGEDLLGPGELEVGEMAAQSLMTGRDRSAGHGCCQSSS